MRLATLNDIDNLSKMLYKMYHEVNPTQAKKDTPLYLSLAEKHIENDDVWVDEDFKGFFIMRDETNEVIDQRLWNGVSVYIEPEYRKTKLLKTFYDLMFEKYDGVIMGYTDVNSEHNKVLLKRHQLLGYVYVLNRS